MNTSPTSKQPNLLIPAVVFLLIVNLTWSSRRFMVVAPGVSLRLDEVVNVESGRKDAKGVFLMTAVYTEQASLLSMLYALFDRSTDIQLYRTTDTKPDEETYEESLETAMIESQNIASALALRKIGYQIPNVMGVRVRGVSPASSFYGKLRPGDVIRGLNGIRVKTVDDLQQQLTNRKAGDLMTLEIRRNGRGLIFNGRLSGEKNTIRLGLDATQAFEYQFPLNVRIDVGDIKGSSGGLMFALEVYNQLNKSDLTKGMVIAGTGSLEPDGTVAAVSGVKQKVLSADRWGADVFIVPSQNASEAMKYSNHMRVIVVDTFKDCLDKLTLLDKS